MIGLARRDTAVATALELLTLDRSGRPACTDSRAVLTAISTLRHAAGEEDAAQLLASGFLAGRDDRYQQHVAPLMVQVGPASFEMGTPPERVRHFCGETPRHPVTLAPFEIARVPVTRRMHALIDPRKDDLPRAERDLPVGNVTWFDSALFALWVGCRLPTEAEWEFACGAGSELEWCCSEAELERYAWFSETSSGEMHPVGRRAPNSLGVHDMHGSVWEWCEDDYEPEFYVRSPNQNPRCVSPAADGREPDKVCRGGSLHSLAEMCRTRYRFHEPPDYWAFDLGFRLARGGEHA
jgi:formylglycine-generating enzyme required for sulfatase activity